MSSPVQGAPACPHGLTLQLFCVHLDFPLPERLYHASVDGDSSRVLQNVALTHFLEKGKLAGLSGLCCVGCTAQGTSVLTAAGLAPPHTPECSLAFLGAR